MKSLIIYFSRAGENFKVGVVDKGNTEIVAEYIAELTDGTLFKVEPEVPYSDNYKECVKQSIERINTHNAPVKTLLTDVDQYDTVFVGSPIYCGALAEEVVTVLKAVDLSNKKIMLFTTHEGSGLAKCPAQIKELTGKEADGALAIFGHQAKESKQQLAQWINQ